MMRRLEQYLEHQRFGAHLEYLEHINEHQPLADGTLPDGCQATHAVVFILGGIRTHWKQVAAYHLTGNSFSAKAMKQVIVDIINECEKIGISVHVVVTDMGGR